MTAQELMEKLSLDAEYQARMAERDQRLEEQEAVWHLEERPIVDDLRREGVCVDSVWDLVNSSDPYPSAIPILVMHLRRSYSDRVKEGIARALAVPEASQYWDDLLAEFEKNPDKTTLGAKWGLACALSVVGHDGVLDDVIRLLNDTRHGQNRGPLLEILARSKESRVERVLLNHLSDEDVVLDAVSAVGKLLLQAARAQLLDLQSHTRPEVRRAAQKALRQLGVDIPEKADDVAVRKYMRRADTIDISDLYEASTDFDDEHVLPFFLGIAKLVSEGFSGTEAHNLTYFIRDMKPATTRSFGFDVVFRRSSFPLLVVAEIGGAGEPGIYCYTGRALTEEIGQLMMVDDG